MSESVLAAAARVDRNTQMGFDERGLSGTFSSPFVDRPSRPHVVAAQDAVEASTVETVLEAKLESIDWEAAQREVNRAIKRGGRDPLSPLATDTLALKAVAALLTRVRQTKDCEPTEAFVAALERGQAIAKAIAGRDADG